MNLDEINQLELELISTVVSKIQKIWEAMFLGKDKVNIEGQKITLNKRCAIFGTFTRESELPYNKVYFEMAQTKWGISFWNIPKIIFTNFRIVYLLNPDIIYMITMRLQIYGF